MSLFAALSPLPYLRREREESKPRGSAVDGHNAEEV
jgi:hypothetical protein